MSLASNDAEMEQTRVARRDRGCGAFVGVSGPARRICRLSIEDREYSAAEFVDAGSRKPAGMCEIIPSRQSIPTPSLASRLTASC